MAELDDGLALLREQLKGAQAEVAEAQVSMNNAQAGFAHWNARKESAEEHIAKLKAMLYVFTGGKEGEPRPDVPADPPGASGDISPSGPQQEPAGSTNGSLDTGSIAENGSIAPGVDALEIARTME